MARKTTDRITFEQLQRLAKQHYAEGGDQIVECWDEKFFNLHNKNCTPMTWGGALELIKFYKSQQEEERAAAKFYSGETY